MTRALDMLRLLLGAVMAVTAIEYFLPSLVPLDARAWGDPAAARLMAALDQSGLLAVAKFIHLVAGALLLANRAVPFALAALMPVNLCGLYIALVLEGEPLLAAFAVLTVTLNALLKLAYLPWYRGVLESGQLADGESAEEGGHFESLFVRPSGRAPARSYLAAAAVLAAAYAFYWFVVPFANGTTGLVTLTIPALLLAGGALRTWTRSA